MDKNDIIFDSDKFENIYFLYKKVFSNVNIKLSFFILLRHNILK